MAYFNFTEHMLKAKAINSELRSTDKIITSLMQDDCTKNENTIKYYYKKLNDLTCKAKRIEALTQKYLSISKDRLEDF
tara:strand:+ start:220 stop:453 length:234 start_codon:yes stop_codon:yes gene_type:complete